MGKEMCGISKINNTEGILLWENSSPMSEFSPQTITLDLKGFNSVMIFIKSVNSQTDLSNGSLISNSLLINPCGESIISTYKLSGIMAGRIISGISSSGIIFSHGFNANSNPANDTAIPLKIWGMNVSKSVLKYNQT